MNQTTILKDTQASKLSKPSKAFNGCVSMLFDEIQYAFVGERPSILLAVHRSKTGQEKAEMALEIKLMEIPKKVVRINPGRDGLNVLNLMAQTPNSTGFVFFVDGLGIQKEAYHALNLYREVLVDHKIKAVFWLTFSEAAELPRLAPDFWAFRHRVVEFASQRGSTKYALPAGVLIWHVDDRLWETGLLDDRISTQEKLLSEFTFTMESMVTHAGMVEELANLYWLKGESRKAMDLLQGEFERVGQFDLNEIKSSLLNGLAIVCYDLAEFKQSLIYIDHAIELSPNHDVLRANRGVVLRAMGRDRDSIHSVKKAIRINPRSRRFWSVLGYVYLSMGRYEDALSALSRAAQLDADDIHVRFAMAVCHSKNGNVGAYKETLRMMDGSTISNSFYYTLCWDGLSQNDEHAMQQLRSALSAGKILPVFVRRDPSLNLIFDIGALGLSAQASASSPSI